MLFQTDKMETRSLVAPVGIQIALFEAVLDYVGFQCFCCVKMLLPLLAAQGFAHVFLHVLCTG